MVTNLMAQQQTDVLAADLSPSPCIQHEKPQRDDGAQELCEGLAAMAISSDEGPAVAQQNISTNPEEAKARKESAFAFLFSGDQLYVLRNKKNILGVPGGKRETSGRKKDETLFDTMRREFREEVGIDMPAGKYKYVCARERAYPWDYVNAVFPATIKIRRS